jgi:hypothetical protein
MLLSCALPLSSDLDASLHTSLCAISALKLTPKADTTRQDLDVVYALEVAVVLSLAPTPYSPRYYRIGAKWEDMRATTATLNLADLEAVAALAVSNPPKVYFQSTLSLAMLPTAARSALALTVKKRLHS